MYDPETLSPAGRRTDSIQVDRMLLLLRVSPVHSQRKVHTELCGGSQAFLPPYAIRHELAGRERDLKLAGTTFPAILIAERWLRSRGRSTPITEARK